MNGVQVSWGRCFEVDFGYVQAKLSTIIKLYWLGLNNSQIYLLLSMLEPLVFLQITSISHLHHDHASNLFPTPQPGHSSQRHRSDHISVLLKTLLCSLLLLGQVQMLLHDPVWWNSPTSPASFLLPLLDRLLWSRRPSNGSPSPGWTVLPTGRFFLCILPACFPSPFRSQRGCHLLWETSSDTSLGATLAGTLYHHVAVLSCDMAMG